MRISVFTLAFLLALAIPMAALAHVFPKNSFPHVGATVTTPPKQVKVWFGGELEPVFSTLIVKNASGSQVSTGNGEVDAKNRALLETALPGTLPAGTYTVYWSAIARDGHHTEGHFAFTVN